MVKKVGNKKKNVIISLKCLAYYNQDPNISKRTILIIGVLLLLIFFLKCNFSTAYLNFIYFWNELEKLKKL